MSEIEIITTTGATVSGTIPVADGAGGYTWEPASAPTGGGSPSGAAGGDLSGTYPNPTVAKVNGQTLGTAALQPSSAFDAAGTATTAITAATGSLAPRANPTFTGTVTVPTPTTGDSSTKAASTAFVATAITAVSGTGGSSSVTSRTITAATTIVSTDGIILADATSAAFTQPLPASFASVLTVDAITATTNLVTLTPAGSDTIEGGSSLTLGTQPSGAPYQSVQLARVGTTWRVI